MDGSIDTLAALIAVVGSAVARVVHRFDVPLLAGGLILHLAADLVRNRGWFGVLRAVGPEHRGLRVRDVQAAAFAGGSVNAFVPARAGDLVKLAVLRRRMPESRMPTLMATLAPETLFEWLAGAVLLSWAIAMGYMPTTIAVDALAGAADHPVTAAIVAAAGAVGLVAGFTVIRRWARRLSHELAAGVAVLREPRTYVRTVASWQFSARLLRLAAIACCLSACRLPGGIVAAAVTMAIDGGTRLRFAPASTGLRVGLLAYALPAATGTAVSVGAVIVYLAVMKATRTACSVAIGGTVLVTTFGCAPRATRSPRCGACARPRRSTRRRPRCRSRRADGGGQTRPSSAGAVCDARNWTTSHVATPPATNGSLAASASISARSSPRARITPPVRGTCRPDTRKRPAA